MVKSVRATYSDGVLRPRERLDLEDGAEVLVSISTDRRFDDGQNGQVEEDATPDLAAGGWKGLIDGEKLKRDIYESRSFVTRSEPKL